jgi:hypothetical protein
VANLQTIIVSLEGSKVKTLAVKKTKRIQTKVEALAVKTVIYIRHNITFPFIETFSKP